MNVDFQSDLATLEFNNREQLEDFHNIIIRLQQEIILSVETISSTRLLLQYMKALSNSDKLKSSISPKMTDIMTFLDRNEKSAVYTGGNIHGIYSCLEIIGYPITLTTSGQIPHHFGTSHPTRL